MFFFLRISLGKRHVLLTRAKNLILLERGTCENVFIPFTMENSIIKSVQSLVWGAAFFSAVYSEPLEGNKQCSIQCYYSETLYIL